jgi:hypothetical protein
MRPHLYWDQSGALGKRYAELLSLRHEGKQDFAWDVWLAYGPDDRWGMMPPKPQVAMDQLDIDPNPNLSYLNSRRFAQRTKALFDTQQLSRQ